MTFPNVDRSLIKEWTKARLALDLTKLIHSFLVAMTIISENAMLSHINIKKKNEKNCLNF